MWTKLDKWSNDALFNTFKTLREGGYTYENLCKYLIEDQIDTIPQLLYNKDMYQKYISQGRQYLHMLHGNNKDHLKRWLYNRFQYVDSLFLQHNSPYTSKSITIRSCKPTWIPEDQRYTARFEIQTYCPQYVTVCWRKNTFETKRVDWGETIVFENEMVNSQDNELIVYCAGNLKYVGDCSGLNPTSVDIGNATRLIEFVCEDSDKLVKADLSKNVYLRRASFKNCSVLGTASGGSNVIDVSECTALKEIDLRGTQVTSLLTNVKGGNLETILYPTSIQNVVVSNQINLKVLGLPCGDDIAPNLTTVQILDCNNIVTLKYPYDESNPTINLTDSMLYVQNLTLANSLGLESISFKGFNKLKTVTMRNMMNMSSIGFDDMLNATDTATLEKITLTNLPQVTRLTFNVSSDDYKVEFVDGVINASGLTSLSSIESNYSIQGLNKLIVPTTIDRIIFSKERGEGNCSLTKIYSSSASTETEDCINLLDVKIRQLMLENLAIPTIKNLYYAPVTTDDKAITLRYITGATGTMDISEYTGTVENLFYNLDIVNNMQVVNSQNVVMPQTDLYRLFYGAILNNEVLDTIIQWFRNTTSYREILLNNTYVTSINNDNWDNSQATNWEGAFSGCTNLTTPPVLPVVVNNISNVLYNCSNISTITLPLTYLTSYNNALVGTNVDITWQDNRTTDLDLTKFGITFTEDDIHELVEHLAETSGATLTLDNSYGAYLTVDEVWTLHNRGWKVVGSNVEIITKDIDVSTLTTNENTISVYIELTADNYTTRIDEVLGVYTNAVDVYFFDDGSVTNLNDMCYGNNNTATKDRIQNVTFIEGYFENCTEFKQTFRDVKGLLTVTGMPDNVIGINYAFCNIPTLISVSKIPSKCTNFNVAFRGCTNLTSVPINGWTGNLYMALMECTSLNQQINVVNPTDLSYTFCICSSLETSPTFRGTYTGAIVSLFAGCKKLTNITLPTTWRPSSTQNTFSNCTQLVTIENLDALDMSNCSNVASMFSGCSSLTDLSSTAGWNTCKVTTISNLCNKCTSLTSIDFIKSWDLSKVGNATSVFAECSGLTGEIALQLNLPKCTTVQSFFLKCTGITSLDVTGWNIPLVTLVNMFTGDCSNLETLIGIETWNMGSNLVGMNYLCTGTKITELNFSNWNFTNVGTATTNSLPNTITLVTLNNIIDNTTDKASNNGLRGLLNSGHPQPFTIVMDEFAMTDFSNLFQGVTKIKNDIVFPTNATNVSNCFKGCTGMTHVHSNWKTTYDDIVAEDGTVSQIVTTDCYAGCTGITHCDGVACEGLDEVPVAWGGFGFSKATTSILELVIPEDNYTLTLNQSMILATLDAGEHSGYNIYNRISWGDGTVTEGEYSHTYTTAGTYTFKGHYYMGAYEPTTTLKVCLSKIHQIPRYYKAVFYNHRFLAKDCKNLTEVTINNFVTTPNNNGLLQAFYGCTNLQKVTLTADMPLYNLREIFRNCTSLVEINGIETWDTSTTREMYGAFYNCSQLPYSVLLQLSNTLNFDSCTNASEMFYNVTFNDAIPLQQLKVSNMTHFDGLLSGVKVKGDLDLSMWNVHPTNLTSFLNSAIINGSVNLSGWDVSSCTSFRRMLYWSNTPSVNLSGWDFSGCTEMDYYTFIGCSASDWDFTGASGIKFNIVMNNPQNHSVDSLVGLFNALYDFASNGDTGTHTIEIGSKNLAKLTDEQIAIATNKGWTVS